MAKRKPIKPADFIVPLNMNGLRGRMLYMPAPAQKKRNILLVYGIHASLERMFGLAEELNTYGEVTMPDLPGLGGMESFYKIGEKPTLDNLADYLAAFVKLRYKRKRVSIIGLSFGFVVATRMLQRYPELNDKVDLLISLVGFVHRDDFRFKRQQYLFLRYGASFFSNRLPAWCMTTFAIRAPIIRAVYKRQASTHSKLKDADTKELNERIEFEIGLWKSNDIRTYMDNGITLLTVNLCDIQLTRKVHHIAVEQDRYFNNTLVEQHLKAIFQEVEVLYVKMAGHAPTVVAAAEEAAPFIPPQIRRLLSKG